MLSTWKTRFQSLIGDQDGATRHQSDTAEDSQTRTLRLLADFKSSLNGVPANDAPSEDAPVADTAEVSVAVIPDEPPQAETLPVQETIVEGVDLTATAQGIEPAAQFIAEHRQTVESLLHKLVALEEYVKSQATATSAFRGYEAAQQRAAEAASAEQQAKKHIAESVERHRASKRELEDANELVEPVRTEAQNAKDRVRELEQQLRNAQEIVDQKFGALDACEARAKECAANEAVAAAEAAKASEDHAACRSASETAQKEAQAAKERAEKLKEESGGQSVTAISDVHKLALKIAEGAAALNGASSH
jgi:hypothetical protein